MPNTHRRRLRNSAVELSRVGGMNAPVGSRDPVFNFLRCWARPIEVGDKWRHNNVIVEKVIKIENSRSQTAMASQQSVSKLSTESVGPKVARMRMFYRCFFAFFLFFSRPPQR